MYLLDTNICIYALKGTYPQLTEKLLSTNPDEILISSITLGELEFGATKSKYSEKNRQLIRAFLANYNSLPFTDRDAILFGQIRAILSASGRMIGLIDAMIGSQGVANGLTVVTHNIREFERIPGIVLEDWAKE